MAKKDFFNILMISLVITFVATVVETFMFMHASHVNMEAAEWDKLNDMNYSEAIHYVDERSSELGGLDIFLDYFSSWPYFIIYAERLFAVFIPVFMASLISVAATLRNGLEK